ncbi:hypothetical protein SAMN04489764_3738 [Thermostaphylospora chromogena]|uniref:2-oxoacid dehydrogenases acyltransferase (Catalytic domain) n=1 Tax=Thermostaphylospora chromogena TaxID=35622 RepID=A0A1H1GQ17_9ACTN|nr:hypothetical protein SAMN04489764_3738 [Thermostaphylospora chromogena]
MAVLTMSFGHRVFDGAYTATFLGRVREPVEDIGAPAAP